MKVSRKFSFSSGHTITGHQGKCRHLHGHNYECEVTVTPKEDAGLDDLGMVVDFSALKAVCEGAVEGLDHHFLIWQRDPRADSLIDLDPDSIVILEHQPTVEYICEILEHNLREVIWDCGFPIDLVGLTVNETEDCRASI